MLNYVKLSIAITVIAGLSGCTTTSVDISSYAPVIDIYQHDIQQYNTDLSQCRTLAFQAQKNTKYREKKNNLKW